MPEILVRWDLGLLSSSLCSVLNGRPHRQTVDFTPPPIPSGSMSKKDWKEMSPYIPTSSSSMREQDWKEMKPEIPVS
jgi:hypothetical protein